MHNPFTAEPHLPVFMIETAAPTKTTVVADHDPRGYGESSSDWRPFSQQELSLAEYARQVVSKLDFKPEVGGIKTVSDPRTRRPGIILVDPWFIAGDSGGTALESAVENLPRWVISLIILNQPDDDRTRKLADQVRNILYAAGALPTDSSRRAARGISSIQDFISIVYLLVTEAERQYMRYSGQYWSGQKVSSPSNTRPNLGHPLRSAGLVSAAGSSASMPDQLQETPDA